MTALETPRKKKISLRIPGLSSSRSRTMSSSMSSQSFLHESVSVVEEDLVMSSTKGMRPHAIPSQYEADMDASLKTLVESMENLSEWEFNSEKGGVKAYTKLDGKLTSVMGVGTLPFPPSAVLEYLFDASRKHEYDTSCAKCTRVRTFDGHTVIDYFASKSVLMVSGRDFVNLVHWRVLSDGTIVMVAKATTDPKCPPNSSLVRGEIHVAGWKIVPSATDKGSTDVTFVIKMDLKGSIPGYIQSKVILDQAFSIIEVAKAMKKQKKPHPVYNVVNLGSNNSQTNLPPPIPEDEDTPAISVVPEPTPNPSLAWISPLYSFFCFLVVFYLLPLTGIDDAVHDVLVWNSILCMAFVLFMQL